MVEKCKASREWLLRVKERSHLHDTKMHGEAPSADIEAVPSYLDPAKIINKGGYTEQQICNQNETALYWKKLTPKDFHSWRREVIPWFQSLKDRLTLLLEANEPGDFVKDRIVYDSENPRALHHLAETTLPLLYKWNNKSWVTAHQFTTWFTKYFKPAVAI